MGKVKSTFKASLDWILKFDIIQRIYEGFWRKTEDTFKILKKRKDQAKRLVLPMSQQ